jgi:hypothetical protein
MSLEETCESAATFLFGEGGTAKCAKDAKLGGEVGELRKPV